MINWVKRFTLGLTLILTLQTPCSASEETELRFGVFANRGEASAIRDYTPVVDFLNQRLNNRVKLEILSSNEMFKKVQNNELDIITTNPTRFLQIRTKKQFSGALATLVKADGLIPNSRVGGVIIVRQDSPIKTLADIKDESLAIINRKSIGGYRAQQFEFMEKNQDFDNAFSVIVEVKSNFRDVVKMLQNKEVNVAFVKDGILERLIHKKAIQENEFKVINQRLDQQHPYTLSTQTYPYWPVFALPHVNKKDAKAFMMALLSYSKPESSNSTIFNYNLPANYAETDRLAKALKLPPYDKAQKVNLADIWQHYQLQISAIIMALLLFITFYYFRESRRKNIIESMIINMEEGVYTIDHQCRCDWANPKALSLLGYEKAEIKGLLQHKFYYDYQQISSTDKAYDPIIETLENGTHHQIEAQLLTQKGHIFPAALSFSPLENGGAIVVFRDISQIKKTQQKLSTLALHDSLTGLGNRVKLIQDLTSSQQPALAIFDINGFSLVNDFYGHEIGNEVLIEFADHLSTIIGNKGNVYRYQSDKFALLLDEIVRKDFIDLALHLIARIESHEYHSQASKIPLKLLTAIAIEPAEKTLLCADMTLMEMKKRNLEFLVYDKSLGIEQDIQHNIDCNKEIIQALKDDRIICHYQPILDNQTQQVEKYESLVRLINEEGQTVLPGNFLQVAKKSKQYLTLSKEVISKTFQTFQNNDLVFSINLTIQDILDPEINRLIDSQLSDLRYFGRVIFEIVETETFEHEEPLLAFAEKIKQKGCSIAIDDFGTGYSNFDYLIRLNPKYVKIDGSLIQNIADDKNSEELVKTIVDFAKKRNQKTIAEFVCSQEVQDKVLELGIDYSQGFHIGKPSETLARVNTE